MQADSIERKQSDLAMTIAKTYAKYRAAGYTCSRKEFHYAAIDNLPMMFKCIGLPPSTLADTIKRQKTVNN